MKADEIAKIQQEFPGISDPKEFQYLAFIVYSGHLPSYIELQNLRGFLHCTSASTYVYSEQLIKKGYLYDATDAGCREEWFMKVALFVMNHYSSWIDSFEKLRPLRSDWQKYIWNIVVFISSRQFKEAKRLPRPQSRKSYGLEMRLDKYISPLIQNSEYDEVATILNEDETQRLINNVLIDALTKDNITRELLQRLDGIIRNNTGSANLFHQECSEKAALMFDQIGAYYYFAFGPEQPGIPFTPAKNDTYWSLGCKGIDYLIRGDLYKAREQFGLALLDFNRIKITSHDAFTFDDPILTYFYGLCIYKSSITPECSGIKSIENALTAFQSVGTRHCNNHIGVTIILNYIDLTDAAVSNVVKSDVIGMVEKNDMPLNRLFASLILGYFKIQEDDSVKSSIGEMDWIPSTKILCHEVSPYIAVGFEMREELNQLYGGAPVLCSIKRKEDWEVLLHDLRTNIVAEVEAQKRIIYFLSGLWIQAIIEQKKLPNGEWDSDQTLSRMDFISCNYDSMNDIDRKVAIALGHKSIGTENDASIILPLLSGSDRVFVGDSFKRPYTPVEVEIVQPYIQFQSRGTSIHIDSNICLDSDEKTLKKSSVQYYEENKYYVVNLSNLQHDLLSRILPTKELPLSALPQLKMIEEKLRHIIDVRSDLALAEAIPQLNGEKTLAVRITPDDGDFNIFFQSCPMPDGQERFAPGEGAEDIFDVENGFTKMVHRDLRGEFDVYNILRKELEAKNVEFKDYQNAIVSNPECLLHLLAFTHEHPDYYIVEWPEGQLLKFKGLFKPSDIDIQVISNIDWFKIQGKIPVGGGRFLSIKELINSFKEAGDSEYIRVGDKEYMKMSKTIQKMKYREYIKKLLEIIRGEQVLVGDPKKILPAPEENDPGMHAVFQAVSDPHFIASRRHDPFWYIKAQQELESLAIKAGSSLNPDQEAIDNIVMEFLEDFLTRVLGMKALEEKLKSESDENEEENNEDVDFEEMEGGNDGEDEEDDTDKSSNNIREDNEPNSNQDFELPSNDDDFQNEEDEEQDFTVGSGDNKAENRKRENAFLRSIPKELFKLAKLIGRSGSAGFRQSGSFPSATKSDITGITIGDNLSSILPSETALLACPATQTVFFRNLVEKRLQIFASASSGTVPIERQDGPVIICLDTSGSMVGEKIDAACVLTMAIAIIAQRRRRDVLIVKYSDWHYLFKVTNMQRDKAGLEMFLSRFEGAGNSENELFRWLFDDILPQEPEFKSADILCVTDFGWDGLHGDTYRRIEVAKKKGLRFYGLNVMSKEDNNGMFQNYCDDVMNEVCDSLWCYQNGRCWEVGTKMKEKKSGADQEEGKRKQKKSRKIGYI